MKVDRKCYKLTEKHVQELRKCDPVPGERALRPARVAIARERVLGGQFYFADFAYVHVATSGKRYRVNGQHTGVALEEFLDTDSFPAGIPLTITDCYVTDESQVIHAFALFDHKLSQRNDSDHLGMYVALHDELEEVDRRAVAKALVGIDAHVRIEEGTSKGFASQDRGQMLVDPSVREYCKFIGQMTDVEWKVWSNKAGSLAFYHVWLKHGDTALDTMRQFCNEDNPDPSSPSRKGMKSLRTWTAKNGWVNTTKCANIIVKALNAQLALEDSELQEC